MRIIFAGSSHFSIPVLETLLKQSRNVVAVYTSKDRIGGRGLKQQCSPIKEFMIARRIRVPLCQPSNIGDEVARMEAMKPDLLISVAYGSFLPPDILNIPTFGCINVHPSVLPRWRGAAPIQRAILAGDESTGVSIIRMVEKMDAGDILMQRTVPIDTDTTYLDIETELSIVGANMIMETIDKIRENLIVPIKQNESDVCYARKVSKSEAKIDWFKSAKEIYRSIRAFVPWPVAYTSLDNIDNVRIFLADTSDVSNNDRKKMTPGTIGKVDKNGIVVSTSDGFLRILKMQFPGGKILDVMDTIKSKSSLLSVGKRFA